MNSRSLIVPATPSPLCHHHQTPLELPLHRDSRPCHGSNRRRLDGDPPHPTELESTSFLFRCAQLVYISNSVFQSRATLHAVILSGPLFTEGLSVDAIVTPELGSVQVVIVICTPMEKLTADTIVAAPHGLVFTHDGNAPRELH